MTRFSGLFDRCDLSEEGWKCADSFRADRRHLSVSVGIVENINPGLQRGSSVENERKL
jgi:hypothetical protein